VRGVGLLFVALAVAGCGSEAHGSAASGRSIFANECARCHSLAGRENDAPGGDLAIPKLTVKDIASFARVMPTRKRLSRAEVQAVAAYVADVARAKRK
jgi:mono/diheme cytochrome c family protein